MNRPTQSLYKDRLPPPPERLSYIQATYSHCPCVKPKKHNLQVLQITFNLPVKMRLAYLILSVFVATVAAVPNQCTPNGLPCDSQTPCCSKLCVIKGDIGSPNENGTCM
ncbi:hypothetical protein ABOM_009008 [Aspergillus bombycis]|uniref:Uncharacterized protein n=1 Tax=Aspergillus bombycis TaxID=109264 RepID=A0A1F7ZTL9_9EURO|nr:hypothetical protein ABOM_009008 [Aspergillus bombycis]OGM42796.1 hypothetical protein ABOM_009008 [Aspergillus bombycis]